VQVELQDLVSNKEFREVCFKELFGPFTIIVNWSTGEEQHLVDLCESMNNHLTAAIVSNDTEFRRYMLGNTVNGTQ